jgi:hypothetical protein
VTALDLAHGVAESITVGSFYRRLVAGRVPSHDEMDAGSCPRCGRALPSAVSSQPFTSRRSVASGDEELIRFCLVDGPRSVHAQSLATDDLFAAAEYIEDDLTTKRWKKWGWLLTNALRVDDTARRAEAVGQSLEMFRRYSTVEYKKAAHDVGSAPSPLEALIVSSATLWPTGDGPMGGGLAR